MIIFVIFFNINIQVISNSYIIKDTKLKYPSYLFNSELSYVTEIVDTPPLFEEKYTDFNEKMKICHLYGLCIQPRERLAFCGFCSVCPRDKSEGFYKQEKDEE